jgi:hypothetical protein
MRGLLSFAAWFVGLFAAGETEGARGYPSAVESR